MSTITEVRDGIVFDYNHAGLEYFGVAFTADSKWFDQADQTDTTIGVHVLPDEQRGERLTRTAQNIEVDLIVHLVKKLAGDTVTEADALVGLLEKFEKFYYEPENPRVSTCPASLTSSTIQLPTRKMLKTNKRFYGWARLTFQLIRTKGV